MKFLGVIWSSEGKKTPDSLINKTGCISTPTAKEAQKVIGLFRYWKQHTPHMGIILKPIYEITRQSREFKWTETQEAAFTYLKNAIQTFNKVMWTLNINWSGHIHKGLHNGHYELKLQDSKF